MQTEGNPSIVIVMVTEYRILLGFYKVGLPFLRSLSLSPFRYL